MFIDLADDILAPKEADSSVALRAVLLLSLFLTTLLASVTPLVVHRAALTSQAASPRQRKLRVLFSHLSCFGGGVFLATCLLDLLPDTREAVNKAFDQIHKHKHRHADFPLAEFFTAFGFLILLFGEQIFLKFQMKELNTVPDGPHSEYHTTEPTGEIGYLASIDAPGSSLAARVSEIPVFHGQLDSPLERSDSQPIEEATIAQDVHFDPTAHSTSRTVLLVLALSVHSVFEGLAVGVQAEKEAAVQVFWALSIHKAIVAMSVGVQLAQSSLRRTTTAFACLTFSATTPAGGAAGLLVSAASAQNPSSYFALTTGLLQGLACGTFLYITCFEILPHELNDSRGDERLGKLLALLAGFCLVWLFVMYSIV